jgi:seryl-tRNA synthetase
MIDLADFRSNSTAFEQAWRNRGAQVDVAALLALDVKVREHKQKTEALRAELNAASKAIAEAARNKQDVNAAKEKARKLGDDVKASDEQRLQAEKQLEQQLLTLPNPCLPGVPVGKDSSENKVSETWGKPPQFSFTPKPHWELGPALDIIDFDRGAKLSGSGFVVLKGQGARLNRALISWFLSEHTSKNGYTELAVPFVVQSQALVGTGQLPKFADQFYACRDDDLVLIPTAEVPVTNYLSGEILEAEDLPRMYTAYTPCFRREAGAAGIGTRGMTRVHQFDKVEVVWLTTVERGEADLMTLRGHAEALLRQLGLHYRVLELCTGDTGFSSAHTFDLEVWSPGTNSWLEVSSCSNFTDFQARRASLRYRKEKGAKPSLLCTLNGSALALPRCLIALLETYQQADGSVTVPEVLRPYFGADRIEKPGSHRSKGIA